MMNLIIAKSINLKIIFLAHIKAPCNIHYLEPIGNNFLKSYINFFEKIMLVKFTRVKMGRIRNKKNEKLFKYAFEEANKRVKKIRVNLYSNSSHKIINILNENYIRKIFDEYTAYELLLIYANEKKLELNKSFKIIFIQKKTYNILNKISQFINNFISIELMRLLVYFSFLIKNILRNNKKFSSNYFSTDNVLLGSEPFTEKRKDKYFRNQKTIATNILNSKNFFVIDLNLKIFYSLNKKFVIKFSSVTEFLSNFVSFIPNIVQYSQINYHLNLRGVVSNLIISYHIWSAIKNIRTKRFIVNGNSNRSSALLIVSTLVNVPTYIYQYSLVGQMNPYLHNPLAGIMGFTKKHIEMFLTESKYIKNSKLSSKIIKYPFAAEISRKRVDNLKNLLLKNFELSIAFFNENYSRDDIKTSAVSPFFYEDSKEDIRKLLLIAKKNPKVAIVVKSKHCQNTLKKHILDDPDLKMIYTPEQFFDIIVPTSYNDRNVVVPAEISKAVDICLTSSGGGTAGYESLASNCRTIFIRSGFSEYDNILPKNILKESIDEFEKELKSVNFNRKNLSKTKIGEADINAISGFKNYDS